MDDLNSTYPIITAFSNFIFNDTVDFTWDNHTSGHIPPPSSKARQQYFWIGMSFVGGLLVGIILHYVYFCLQKYLLSRMEDEFYQPSSESGVVNLSYISEPPVDDHPPDYASVVSGENADQKVERGFFARFFKRSPPERQRTAQCVEEEPPPSYASVETNFEVELGVRWQSDLSLIECSRRQ